MKIKRKLFIVVEGPNFAGKSTLIGEITEMLSGGMVDVVATREPGGTPFGEGLRRTLKDPDCRAGTFASALAFNAGRKEHCDMVIEPVLARGGVLICDRYYWSTEVYQGELAGDVKPEEAAILRSLHKTFIQPDFVIFLMPSRSLLRARIKQGARGNEADRFEGQEGELAAYERIIENFAATGIPCAVFRPNTDEDAAGVGIEATLVIATLLPGA